MAKGHNNPGNENDYVEQLQWRATHRRRASVRFEPKWKYKIAYKHPYTHPFGRFLQFVMLAATIFLVVTLVLSSGDTEINIGSFIVGGILILLITVILFFATRDGNNNRTDDSEEAE